MARRRMIDPGFWASEHNINLIYRQRLLFLGLISNADDEGRIKGNLNFIRAMIFPYDELTSEQVKGDLELLASEGLIIQYNHNGLDCIQILKWKQFQTINKPQASKIPAFSGVVNDSLQKEGMIHDKSKESFTQKVVNDSDTKERKGKEEKGKEEEVLRQAQQSGNPLQPLFAIWGTVPDLGETMKTNNLVKQYGFDRVKQAFYKASIQKKKSVAYVIGILNSPERNKTSKKEERKIGS